MRVLLISGSHSRHMFVHQRLTEQFEIAGAIVMGRERVLPSPPEGIPEVYPCRTGTRFDPKWVKCRAWDIAPCFGIAWMNLDPGRATSKSRDFRLFPKSAYRKRQGANPRYALRADARSWQTSHSVFSQNLRATRRLTLKTAIKQESHLAILETDLQAIFANDLGERRSQSSPTPG